MRKITVFIPITIPSKYSANVTDRDVNAAKNILAKAKEIQAV